MMLYITVLLDLLMVKYNGQAFDIIESLKEHRKIETQEKELSKGIDD